MEDLIKKLPEQPGCYLYKNENGKIIYVGKSKNLKKRVASYFTKAHNYKTTQLIREIKDIETIITNNEKESLILEQNLIKKYRPKYNVVLNDDKKYPYISITNEKDPTYVYTRNYNNKNLMSFGPLPDGTSARNILKVLERIYPLRKCKGNLKKPCMHYHIKQCSGACFKEVDQAYYQEQIKNVQNFFNNKNDNFKSCLNKKMLIAADNLQFEEAQRIKNIMDHINFFITNQVVEFNDNLNRDVFNFYKTENYICFVVLFYRYGKLILKDQFICKNKFQSLEDLFENFVNQIYTKNMLPDLIIIPKTLEKSDLKMMYINKINFDNDPVNIKLLDLAESNAREYICQHEKYQNQKSISKEDLLLKLQKILDLKVFPYHIEMYDVANILDEYVTGAKIVYKNGQPSYSDFRRYHIEIEQKGDYQRMQNMIFRRFQKDVNNLDALPDLIIMDGGQIQVNAAKSQLSNLNLNIAVIGLVKNDFHKTEYILNWNNKKIYLEKSSEEFKFLEAMQNRVHNFAISGFKKRQSKAIFKDELFSIKGVGQKLVEKLNNQFPIRKDLYNASIEEIKKIVKNEQIAKAIKSLKK